MSYIQKTTFVAFLVASLCIAFLTGLFYIDLRNVLEASEQEGVTLKILRSVEVLHHSLQYAGEELIRYKQTNAAHHLGSYTEAGTELERHVLALDAVDSSDEVQQKQLQQLIKAVYRYKSAADSILKIPASAPPTQPLLASVDDFVHEQLDLLHEQVLLIENRSRAILQAADEERKQQMQNTLKVFIWFSVGVIVFFAICYMLVSKALFIRNRMEEKLRKSELLFSTVFYKSPVICCITELGTGRLIDVNDNFTSFFGFTREEVIGERTTDLGIWKSIKDRMEVVNRLKLNKSFRNVELQLHNRHNEPKDISAYGEILTLDDRECVVAAFVDISERKEAENASKRLNALLEQKVEERTKEIADYKYALDQAAIVAITDEKGVIRHVNDNFSKISKYDREEIIGHNHRMINSGYHPKQYFSQLWRTISGGKIWKGEIRNRAKDGTLYWVDTTIVPFQNAQGKPYQYLAIRWDITDRKKAEEALLQAIEELEEGAAKLKEAQAIARIGSWDYEFDSEKSSWSDEMYRLFGTSPEETQPSLPALLSFVHPDDVDEVKDKILLEAPSGHRSFYYRIIRGKEEVRCTYNELQYIHDEQGMLLRVTGIVHDVTEEKLVQEEKDKVTADLLQRNKDLEQFAYIVSHNLRAPVANVIGLTSLIHNYTPGEANFDKCLDGIQACTRNLDEVVRDLNHVLQVKLEHSETKEMVNLSELVDEIKTTLQNLIVQEEAVIYTDFTQVGELYAIKSFMFSIFYNLITNSLKFRHPERKPFLEIFACKMKGDIVLNFRDNGLGINLDAHGRKIFGLYKRFHLHTQGKGMGLFMVKSQVETLGGSIAVESEANKGAHFILTFKS
ncbi:PAS domain S-box protein [Pontibacter sp. SGAir0037]|uniref:PAS domain-containing sensor histidine kinase n=1 Tax=Pontibacter sp. SGAir0037 TaxID=2571030 RepID=UPI0010CD1140|nr:PAS domain S-box protein [Pontibacter sp. SGAir0037]QCR21600.1 hypothetical protein C1N53_04060 [Pontibacter sp. SGAir0037]